MRDDTCVIVPFFNEGSVIKATVDILSEQFSNIACIDDGSTDGGAEALRGANCTVVTHPVNLGQGAALQTGIEFALRRSSIRSIVTFDADGQHRVEDAVSLVELLESSGVDVVFGSRFLAGSEDGPTGVRRAMLRVAIPITNLMSGLKLTDTHNGLRAFNRRFAESLRLESNDMNHASEFITHTARGGFTYREAPTAILYTEYSLSKGQSLMNAVNIALDVVLDLFRKRRSR
jgi:glycosyltransferase involved in cell wall biosynthesis